ncbi:ARM repeat-containing protein [Dentipellis sp. KUC8613]|nr:ARM repeat-containing protein [Dentipellis sp. KUC8613]
MSFLPVLPPQDVEQAAQLIRQVYTPTTAGALSADEQRRINADLFELQKRWEAWGLVIPFLDSPDENVQFFGAHTAQVKIARDWDSFPPDQTTALRDLLLQLTGTCIAARRSKVIIRKLFVALCSLALKLAPGQQSQWPDWVLSCVTTLSGHGASAEYVLEFLEIVAEEVQGADLLAPKRVQMQQTLTDAVPLVTQAIRATLTGPHDSSTARQFGAAMKCFEAWVGLLPGNDLTPLIEPLISHLDPTADTFEPATDALIAILSSSVLSSGAAPRTLTEPLLLWCAHWGTQVVAQVAAAGGADDPAHTLCKLLAAIGDHSTDYLATHLAAPAPVEPAFDPVAAFTGGARPPAGQLVQTFLRLLLAFTAMPGYYGVDEEESDMTLGFWYLLQEALWNADVPAKDGERRDAPAEKDVWAVASAVYAELVAVLRRKVMWPKMGSGWSKDQVEKFQVYRRDVGDTLINAYYILRNDMLAFYVNDILERLSKPADSMEWEEVEATIHCTMSIQEAVPVETNSHLERLFSPEILGRLPTEKHTRLRRSTLGMIGSYASWFTVLPTPDLLLGVLRYVSAALSEPALCLPAANALRDLCDDNRTALAPHIAAFGELHANLVRVPDTEKAKVLQSIASVIQALPPEEQIPPVEAIVTPVVAKLMEALQSSSQLPEEARALAIHQLQTLTGVAKGLTRSTDAFVVDEDVAVEETKRMETAREDARMVRVRMELLRAVQATVELWSTDALISDALSEMFKSITALPVDASLVSLPSAPLLELVCSAAQRQLTAVWLSLATMLAVQLDPPSIYPSALRALPGPEAKNTVRSVVLVLLQTALGFLGVPGAMEANPDIIHAFFDCMEKIAMHFVSVFYQLPEESFNALIQCAITCLSLQERYSVVAASMFLVTLINRTHGSDDLGDVKNTLLQVHGPAIMRAVLSGFAGVAPRSATPNLIDLLSTLITKQPVESKSWMSQILYADDFMPSKAGPEAKDKFIKSMFSSRTMRRTREAAQQFTLVARGLEGSSFGYTSVTM